MIQKIKQWWLGYKIKRSQGTAYSLNQPDFRPLEPEFTKGQLENAYRLGYNDGRRDGLAIARKQATNSLKEILWAQNQKKR